MVTTVKINEEQEQARLAEIFEAEELQATLQRLEEESWADTYAMEDFVKDHLNTFYL